MAACVPRRAGRPCRDLPQLPRPGARHRGLSAGQRGVGAGGRAALAGNPVVACTTAPTQRGSRTNSAAHLWCAGLRARALRHRCRRVCGDTSSEWCGVVGDSRFRTRFRPEFLVCRAGAVAGLSTGDAAASIVGKGSGEHANARSRRGNAGTARRRSRLSGG